MYKKNVVLVYCFIMIFLEVPAQENDNNHNYIKNQMSVSVAYSKIPLATFHPNFLDGNKTHGGDIKVLYGINTWLEVGVECDVSLSKRTYIQFPDMENHEVFHEMTSTMLIYQGYVGGTAKMHPLSIPWPDFFLADIYVSGLAGAYYGYIPMWSKGKLGLMVQCGIGVGINPSKNWGLFLEYGMNNQTKTYILTGLTFRFGGPKKWQR